MAEKKKGKKARKQKEKIVDEYQLRRDLREQAKMAESADVTEKVSEPTQKEPQRCEDARIGGIEG